MVSSATRTLVLARPLGVALHVALVILLVLAAPVLAGDPSNGNGNGKGNGKGNGNGPERTESPGNGGAGEATAPPVVLDPTPIPTGVPPVPAAVAPAAPPPEPTPEPARPQDTLTPAATAVASAATSRPAAPPSAGGTTSTRPPASERLSTGGHSSGAAAAAPAAAPATAEAPASPAVPRSPGVPPRAIADPGSPSSAATAASPFGRSGHAMLLPALVLLATVAVTAGGLVLVGRRRGVLAADPAAVPAGPSPVVGVVPPSDPLIAALQGSSRFAPPDGTTALSHGTTHGDGAPLWVRRLDPRIPVMPMRAAPDETLGDRTRGLEEAMES